MIKISTYITIFSLIFLGFACNQKEDESKITVIQNVMGYTFYDGELKKFSALAFRDSKVIDIYRDTTFQSNEKTEVINGNGKVMLSGLADAHVHVMDLGFQQINVNLTGTQSLENALQKVKDYASGYSKVNWIQGRGWNHTHWKGGRFPTAKELDRVANDRPVWLRRIDMHAGWANSKAMELAEITTETEDPKDGKIIRDETGKATGVFVDGAMDLIESKIPDPKYEERKNALEKALQKMRSKGLTEVHVAGINGNIWDLFKQFANEDKLTTRIYGMIHGTGADFDSLSADGPITSYDNDMLALRSVKLFADGALGSRGAAMLEPYSDDPGNSGLLFHSQEKMNKMVLKANANGYQVNAHAIGDRANREVLNAFEAARDSLGDQGLRNRIEHAQIVALRDIPRFTDLNIIASMQPTHATSDMNMAKDRIGSERLKGGYAWRTFLDQGTIIASGSDFPVEDVNPFFGLYSAVSRQDHQGKPEGGWHSEQTMTRKEAFRSFTLDAAYAAHQEDVLGSLEPGKWADFILIDRDYFKVPTSEIWKINVLETWVAGKKVFSANNQ